MRVGLCALGSWPLVRVVGAVLALDKERESVRRLKGSGDGSHAEVLAEAALGASRREVPFSVPCSRLFLSQTNPCFPIPFPINGSGRGRKNTINTP